MPLEWTLPKSELTEFHARLCVVFGRVGRSIDDETAAEGLTFIVLPSGRLTSYVAMH